MAVEHLTNNEGQDLIICLSTDTKPTPPGAISAWKLFEWDTGVWYKWSLGWVATNKRAQSSKSVAAPTGTTSTTGVMLGLGATITPILTGVIKVTITGSVKSSVIGDGAFLQIRFGTGTPPTNGAALTGTTLGSAQKYIAPTVAAVVPFCLCFYTTPQTLNVAMWVDQSVQCITGGTTTITNVDITCEELNLI